MRFIRELLIARRRTSAEAISFVDGDCLQRPLAVTVRRKVNSKNKGRTMAVFHTLVCRAWALAILCLLTATLSRATTAPVRAQSPDIRGPFVAPTAFAASFDGDVRQLPHVPAAPQVM